MIHQESKGKDVLQYNMVFRNVVKIIETGLQEVCVLTVNLTLNPCVPSGHLLFKCKYM